MKKNYFYYHAQDKRLNIHMKKLTFVCHFPNLLSPLFASTDVKNKIIVKQAIILSSFNIFSSYVKNVDLYQETT